MTTLGGSRRRIAIVGAGVMGLSAAVEMAAIPGAHVTLLEAGHPGSGSTSRSVGVYTRQYMTRRDVELRARSIEILEQLERAGRIILRRIGFIRLGRDPEAAGIFEKAVETQKAVGVSDPGRVIDADEFGRLVPDFDGGGVVSCLYGPADGYTDGAVLCSSLAEEALELGVRIVVKAPLRSARRARDRSWGLSTDAGDFDANVVVNCAGAWAGQVGEILDAPVQMVNERHEAFNLELPSGFDYEIPMVMDYVPDATPTDGLYFRHEGENQLVAGIHSSDILGADQAEPNDYFEGVTDAGTERIVAAVDSAFPNLDGIRLRGGWAGLYPYCEGGKPLAGPHTNDPSVLVGAGLGGVGLSVAPVMARLLREWVEFGEPRTIEDAFDMVPPAA